MKIIRAEHLGMCFGVRDAIALAHAQARVAPLTVFGALVHNQTVLDDLSARGVRIESRIEELGSETVMITAHGASQRRIQQLEQRGLNVIEATCPLVRSAHDALHRMTRAGYHPVIIGQRSHVEVLGMTEDLDVFDVILEPSDIRLLAERPRFGVVSQTTQPVARARELVGLLRARFPKSEVRFADTVCRPTKQRQQAAVDLAAQCDVVIVIGGANSNNTRELVQTCGTRCERVHHVQSAADLDPAWLKADDTVGVTAGTSTPDILIDGVEAALQRWNESWPAAWRDEPAALLA